ncbi:UvrD-helicase domain-containing protein [Neisseria sp. Ec49-e6-T10]|uniref:UvrD-helicase domain-containing protein n=1 Tax=Neisseria sp. Ec49-e6-T10 TaxID=3140744 RepID=UPI003EB98E16
MLTLNVPQRQAITYLDGPLLVLAGAGSGKTRVITHKIAYLIEQANYKAHNIAAITFTNKAAKEMQERLQGLLPKTSLKGITVSTFHSLGMRILREEAPYFAYKKQFSILDANDTSKIIRDFLVTTSKEEIFRAQNQLSLWKNQLITPESAFNLAQNDWEAVMARLYASYQDTLFAYQAVDFDDLLRLPTQLFLENTEAQEKWQHRLRYLLIDEYQDTNHCQYELVKLLVGKKGMFTAVGDDNQSIYAWRGANIENLNRLQNDFYQLKIIKLEQNYRSSRRILHAANTLISHNPRLYEKKLWSEHGVGDPIEVIVCKDEEHEADIIVNRLITHRLQHNKKLMDYAILYRSNHQARILEKALRDQRILYQISGGQSFFDKAEIKDVLAYLRLLNNPDDDPAFIRALTTPKKGVGNQSLEKLNQYAKSHQISLFAAAKLPEALDSLGKSQSEALQYFTSLIEQTQESSLTEPAGAVLQNLLKTIDYENHLFQTEELRPAEIKWKNTQDLASWLTKKGEQDGKNLLELSQTLALMNLLEGKEEGEIDAVKLSTLHASKGLEYPYVFLIGCEEGILPHSESSEAAQIEEERRLMYVGVTRAQQNLTLTYCAKRRKAGTWQFIDPSRFIDELPQEDLKFLGKKGSDPIVSKTEGQARLAGLSAMLSDKIKDR